MASRSSLTFVLTAAPSLSACCSPVPCPSVAAPCSFFLALGLEAPLAACVAPSSPPFPMAALSPSSPSSAQRRISLLVTARRAPSAAALSPASFSLRQLALACAAPLRSSRRSSSPICAQPRTPLRSARSAAVLSPGSLCPFSTAPCSLDAHAAFRRPSPCRVLCAQSRPTAWLWPPSCLGFVHPSLFSLGKKKLWMLGPRLDQVFRFGRHRLSSFIIASCSSASLIVPMLNTAIPAVPRFRCVRLNVGPRFHDVTHPRCETLTLIIPCSISSSSFASDLARRSRSPDVRSRTSAEGRRCSGNYQIEL
ncbi:uncharacterized protein LOC100384547 precursor [Zea mays]|jgi:hypothetical protein|uniref:Uncharacterized protein n=1 Tax=Zea mays TaxID=4577 RepID=C4IYH8_MAIZE|nr:uncharacterized protein LOC100384547 precursor [Zea mays]ACR33978.1 unknown [Zea mays]|eukprot:NP_001170533.1 uncharacterized protein LOC100384547 precursor [Zea mays]